MNPCPACSSTKQTFNLKLIPTNRSAEFYPKYIPQIKPICANCGRYLKFESQTPELIEKINQKLEGIKCG